MANRINYQLEMEKVLSSLPAGAKPKLLLHACCAPCSSAVLERLREHFSITILYYNPNIYPPQEYHRREQELERFLQDAGMSGISLIELPYDPQEFYTAVKGLEAEPERGERCTVCYRLRMEQAARYAAAKSVNRPHTALPGQWLSAPRHRGSSAPKAIRIPITWKSVFVSGVNGIISSL